MRVVLALAAFPTQPNPPGLALARRGELGNLAVFHAMSPYLQSYQWRQYPSKKQRRETAEDARKGSFYTEVSLRFDGL